MSDAIHDKFLKFSVEGSFKYQSILVYLFLYHEVEIIKFPMKKLDVAGAPKSIIHWKSLVRNISEEFSFSDFVNQFIYMEIIY